jgi:hypothetical protein
MKESIVGIGLASLLTLGVASGADAKQTTSRSVSIGDNKLKVISAAFGDFMDVGGLHVVPSGKEPDEICLIVRMEQISGSSSSLVTGVTDENQTLFDRKSCLTSSKAKKHLLDCIFAVDKSSHSFVLHFSGTEDVVMLSPFRK